MMSSDSFLPNTSKLSRESTNGDKLWISGENVLSPSDQAKTIETVKILIAMLYTIKNHLRAEWGVALSPGTSLTADGQEANTDEYKDLLPPGLKGFEHRGLGLTLELACFVEKYIQMGVKKYEHSLFSQVNTDVILGNGFIMRLQEQCFLIWMVLLQPMEAWKSYDWCRFLLLICKSQPRFLISKSNGTLCSIHHKQTLALFCGILPFAMASEMDWWAVPLVAFVSFTL